MRRLSLATSFAAFFSLFLLLASSQSQNPPQSQPATQLKERHFTFHYSFTVKNVTPGQPLHVWIPLAHSDASQDVASSRGPATCL